MGIPQTKTSQAGPAERHGLPDSPLTCRRPASTRGFRLPTSPQTRPSVPRTRMWLAAAGARVSNRVPGSRTDPWDRSGKSTRMRCTVPSMSSQPGPLPCPAGRYMVETGLHPSVYDLPPSVCRRQLRHDEPRVSGRNRPVSLMLCRTRWWTCLSAPISPSVPPAQLHRSL